MDRKYPDKPFSIFSEHRPRRIAFLLDPSSVSIPTIAAIIRFNIDSWNGRYNPLIPLNNGEVYADYWRLLDIVDPDIIYSFSDLHESTITRLDTELGPVSIEKHHQRPDEQPTYIGIHGQASVKGTLINLTDRARRQGFGETVSVLNFGYGNTDDLSNFVQWNFGISKYPYFIARDHGLSIIQPQERSDESVMNCIADHRSCYAAR